MDEIYCTKQLELQNNMTQLSYFYASPTSVPVLAFQLYLTVTVLISHVFESNLFNYYFITEKIYSCLFERNFCPDKPQNLLNK